MAVVSTVGEVEADGRQGETRENRHHHLARGKERATPLPARNGQTRFEPNAETLPATHTNWRARQTAHIFGQQFACGQRMTKRALIHWITFTRQPDAD